LVNYLKNKSYEQFITNTNFNNILQRIYKQLKLTRLVKVYESSNDYIPLCKRVGSHSGRQIGIYKALLNNSVHNVQSITGHSHSNMLDKYVDRTNQRVKLVG